MSLQGTIPAEQTSVNRENPYLGLQSFREQDHDFFHGRDSEIENLFRLVRRDVLTALFGMSGLGKTSLLNAGLFPKLREALYLPISIRLDFGAAAPGLISQIKARVAVEVENYCIDTPSPSEHETLWEYFHRTHFWNQQNRLFTPVLVFDQFEELFTLGRGNDRVAPFLQELSDVIENHIPEAVRAHLENSGEELSFSYDKPSIKVIFSLREDYLAHLEELRHSIPSLSRNRYRLTRMDGERALEAVLIPGEHLLTREVAQSIVLFAAGAANHVDLKELEVEPALLSLVCRELNSRRLESNLPRISSELLSGSKDRIIADFYENNISGLDPGVRVFVEEHLLTTSGFRSTKALDDALQLPGVSKKAIDTLVNHRLVRLEDRLGIQHVELIHDVLAGVIQESRARRHEKQAMDERERAAWQRKIKYGKRALNVLAVGCIVLSIFAFIQYKRADNQRLKAEWAHTEAKKAWKVAVTERERANNEARRATSRELAQASMGYTEVDPMLSLILAREAVNKAETSQALGALHRAMVVSQIRRTLQGHRGSVRDVAYSPDGEWVATASMDKTAKLWNVETGEERHSLKGHKDQVTAVAFSPDGKWLATASMDKTAKLWNVETGEERHSLEKHKRQVTAVAFSPDGKWLATASADRTAKLWNVETGEERHSLEKHKRQVTAVAFSPKGKWLATASKDEKAKLWNVETGEERHSLEKHKRQVTAVAFSPDGKWLATASKDRTAKLWNVETGEEHHSLEGHKGQVTAVAFSPDGTRLATGGNDQVVLLFNSTSGEMLYQFKDHPGPVKKVAFSPDQTRLAAAGGNGVKVWDSESKELLFTLSGHKKDVKAIAFSSDGGRLATASDDKTAKLWNVQHHEELSTLTGHRGRINALDYSPDGKMLAMASDDKLVSVWNTETGDQKSIEHSKKMKGVVFSPDGRVLAAADTNGTITIWNPKTGEMKDLHEERTKKITTMRFSPDGQWLATASMDGTLILWDARTGKKKGEIKEPSSRSYVSDARFNPNGSLLTTVNNKGIPRVWDTTSGEDTESYPVDEWEERLGFQRVRKVALSPDGGWLAATLGDRTLRIWALSSEEELFALRGHKKGVSDIAFSRGGTVLAVGYDKTVKLWDMDSGQELFTLFGHAGPVTSVAVNPDGTQLATGNSDNTIHRYILDVAQLKSLSEDRITRELSDQECGTFEYLDECKVARLVNLGRKNAKLERIQLAVEDFTRAKELKPELEFDNQPDAESYAKALAAETLSSKGKRYARNGEVERAIKTLRRAQEYNPDVRVDIEEINRMAAPALVRKGRVLAGKGDASGAIAAFTEALKLDPAIKVDPENETAKGLIRKGRDLGRMGEVEEALVTLRKAVELAPDIGVVPEVEVAKGLAENGRRSARDGKVEDALQAFRKAVGLASDIGVVPEVEVAKGLVARGRRLGQSGKVEDAVKTFRKALEFDPNVKVNIEKETARALVHKGRSDVKAGRVKEAIAVYEKAQVVSPGYKISSDNWNSLCWNGCLWGHAADVMFACKNAVDMTNGKEVGPRDSRGVALAVTGDFESAIEDFKYYVKFGPSQRRSKERISKRERWIEALESGQNPFPPSVLKALRSE